MKLLADIFLVVTLPIIALIAVGYGVQMRVPEARKTLSYVYTNVVLPCFMVYFLSTTTLPLTALWPVVWFTVLQSAVVGAAGWLLARQLRLSREVRPVVAIGGVFANTGNFGVPLAILAFPCNQFGRQEPGTAEQIRDFCTSKYKVSFDLFEKIDVKGKNQDPLYKWLTSEAATPADPGPVKWNFEKFLIGRDGSVLHRYPPQTKPRDNGLMEDIAAAL